MDALFIITLFFTTAYTLLILWYWWGWIRLKEFIPAKRNVSTKISVIIAARNEEANISNLLNDLNDQSLSRSLFEIIVVDDFSNDKTAQLVKQINFPNVKLIQLKDHLHPDDQILSHKKKAIEIAVASATGELIVTTDADCRHSSNWLFSIAGFYEENKPAMIAGPVNFFYDRSLLGKFQTLDFLSLVGIAAASIKNGFYNLCNGANLAYSKEAFLAVGGYSGIDHIASGDDMMLMHKIGKKFPGKIMYIKNKDAIVYTHTEKDLSSFWHQRLRWTSKSTHYEDKRITYMLTFVYLFNLLQLTNLVTGLFIPFYLRLSLWQFMVKIVIDTLFIYSVARFFRRENLLWLFLPVQVVHVVYVLLIAPFSIFGNYNWKGRTARK